MGLSCLPRLTHSWAQYLLPFYWGWRDCALRYLAWHNNDIAVLKLKIWENPNLLITPFKKLLSPLYFPCSNVIVQYYKSYLISSVLFNLPTHLIPPIVSLSCVFSHPALCSTICSLLLCFQLDKCFCRKSWVYLCFFISLLVNTTYVISLMCPGL